MTTKNDSGKRRKSLTTGYFFKNGSSILFVASDDKQKFRSTNASKIVVIEGDHIDYSIIKELTGRLRNEAAVEYKRDRLGNIIYETIKDTTTGTDEAIYKKLPVILRSHFTITIEANPDPTSYVYNHGVLESSEIYYTESVRGISEYEKRIENGSPYKTTFLSATPDNPFANREYIKEKLNTWTKDEVDRNLYALFSANDNLVYPDWEKMVVETKQIDSRFPSILVIDPGVGEDPTAMIVATYDPYQQQTILHSEYYEYKQSLTEIAEAIKHRQKIYNIQDIVIDPSSQKTLQLKENTSTKRELENLLGTELKAAVNNIDDGIRLTKNAISSGRLKVLASESNFIKEISHYSWAANKDGSLTGKPAKGIGDHLMDTMRYFNNMYGEEDLRNLIDNFNRNFVLTSDQFTPPWETEFQTEEDGGFTDIYEWGE